MSWPDRVVVDREVLAGKPDLPDNRKPLETSAFQRGVDWFFVRVRRAARGILPQLALLVVVRVLVADSLPWGAQSIRQTGIRLAGLDQSLLSPAGDIFLVANLVDGAGYSVGSALIRKVDATSRQLFAVPIAGVYDPGNILLGPDGDVYFTGHAAPGKFVTTPGAHDSTGWYGNGAFLCKLSGADGRILFCTYVDVMAGYSSFAVDAGGHVYLAGVCASYFMRKCVEKFNPEGTGLDYQISLEGLGVDGVVSALPDARGHLYLNCLTGLFEGDLTFVLADLDGAGTIHAVVHGNPNELATLELDPAGNPQTLIADYRNPTSIRVRKYGANLSGILFETRLPGFQAFQMMIGPEGDTVLLGGTDSVNLLQVHPTAACDLSSSTPKYPFSHGVLVRLDGAGHVAQSTFLAGTPGIANGFVRMSGATVLVDDIVSDEVALMELGPAPEVRLGCAGNAAAFQAGPLAPAELVSLFGQRLGPDESISGQPGQGNRYPFQLAGTEVTFDGVPAPLFYVSGSQITAVTPRGLAGKTTTHVCVVVTGVETNCIEASVQPAAPGVFSSGTIQPGIPGLAASYAAALNQDGTINSQSNPAAVGSIVSIFATGMGMMIPAPEDGGVIGWPPPSQELNVQVSQLLGINIHTNSPVSGSVSVLYAGPAPMAIEGLSQINFQVPVQPGAFYVVVSSGAFSVSTATGVQIWVTGGQ